MQCSTEDILEKWAKLWKNSAVTRSAARLQQDDELIFSDHCAPFPFCRCHSSWIFSQNFFVSLMYKSKVSAVFNQNICASMDGGAKAEDLPRWRSTAASLCLQRAVQGLATKLQLRNFPTYIVETRATYVDGSMACTESCLEVTGNRK